jgi:predicted nucleotidyltransferase
MPSSSSSSLTKKEKQALKLFKKELQKAFPNQLHSLKLFGSKARGDAAKYSDVDVLVVLKRGGWRQRKAITGMAAKIFGSTGIDLSPKVFTVKQLAVMQRRRNAFILSVKRDAREI